MRDTENGPTTLLLQRNRNLQFAPGVWVFPGGRIDNDDYAGSSRTDIQAAARRAATREAREEAGVTVDPDRLRLIDHFVTPENQPRRFSTWFYLADANHCGEISIDGGEIIDYNWLAPQQALNNHQAGLLPLIRPTRKTLERLVPVPTVAQALCLPTLCSG